MNGKIVFSIFIAFIISFSIFLIIQNEYQDEINFLQNEFYSKKVDPQIKKIFLIGSSHVGQLNATHIEQKVLEENFEFKIFNLADTADKPKSRINSLEKIISQNPEMVVYGVGLRDFAENKKIQKETLLPDPQTIFENIFSIEQYGFNIEIIENPKLSTLKILQSVLGIKTLVSDSIFEENTPFYPYHKNKTNMIVSQEYIKNEDFHKEEIFIEPYSKNKQVIALNKIISELERNDIKVIIFITPHSGFYMDSISVKSKENFDSIISNLLEQNNLEQYNFVDSYNNLEIWRSTNHISHNSNALIYSEDIANVIIKESND